MCMSNILIESDQYTDITQPAGAVEYTDCFSAEG